MDSPTSDAISVNQDNLNTLKTDIVFFADEINGWSDPHLLDSDSKRPPADEALLETARLATKLGDVIEEQLGLKERYRTHKWSKLALCKAAEELIGHMTKHPPICLNSESYYCEYGINPDKIEKPMFLSENVRKLWFDIYFQAEFMLNQFNSMEPKRKKQSARPDDNGYVSDPVILNFQTALAQSR